MTSEVTAPNVFICAENVEASRQDFWLCVEFMFNSDKLQWSVIFHFADKLKG